MKYKFRWMLFLVFVFTPSFVVAATPTVVLKVNNGKVPVLVPYRSHVTLSWVSTGATSCTASEDQTGTTNWEGSLILNGSNVTSNLSDSNTFTITCKSGSGQTVTDSVIVNVIPQVAGPTVTITADDQEGSVTIPYGGTTTLAWSSTDTIFCGDLVAGTSTDPTKVIAGKTDGSKKISNLKNSQSFVITCEGLTGKLTTARFDVEVIPLPLPTIGLTIDNQEGSTTIPSGASTTLSWTSTDTSTSSCNLFSSDLGLAASSKMGQNIPLTPTGQKGTEPLFSSKVFLVSCKNESGIATSSVIVNVTPADDMSGSTATTTKDAILVKDTTSCTSITRNMGYGSDDKVTENEVSTLQSFLSRYGVYKNTPSGFLGKGTTLAVRRFQKKEGILQTGFVGPLTRTRIKRLSCQVV